MSNSPIPLLQDQDGTGNGDTVKVAFPGLYVFSCVGTFSGTSVMLQRLGPDDTTWLDCLSAAMTSADQVPLDLPAGSYRVTRTSGTPEGLYASLDKAG